MLEEFRYIVRFRAGFADIDRLQHVNNAVYIRWMEHARIEYFADVFGIELNSETRTGVVQANVSFHYEKMVFYRDDVAVGVRVSRLGTKSFELSYSVVNETRGERAGYGETTLVAFDFVGGKSIAIPAEMRRQVADYEIVPPAGL